MTGTAIGACRSTNRYRVKSDDEISVHLMNYSRSSVHREPVRVDGHVHVFPALHVPPFEHTGLQTAKD